MGRSEFTLYSRGADEGEVMSAFLTQYYCDAPVPADISLNILPDDHTVVEWLQDTAAGKLDITVPARGRKKELVDMAYKMFLLPQISSLKNLQTTHNVKLKWFLAMDLRKR